METTDIEPQASGGATEIWRGSVNTWECDSMGHMNVRFYVAKAMEGLVAFAAELGLSGFFASGAERTLIIREHHIRFLREAKPHAPLYMTGSVADIGGHKAKLLLMLRHATGELAASFLTDVEHIAADMEEPIPWPDHVKIKAQKLMAAIPPEATPRTLNIDPVKIAAHSVRADELSLERALLAPVGVQDCDVHGRMRAEFAIGRISDSMPHSIRTSSPEVSSSATDRNGGAAIEYRLIYQRWPKVGDLIEIRSGLAGADARVRRQVHWLLNPRDGKPWASAQAAFVAVDRVTRKLTPLSDDQLAIVQQQVTEGLGY
jgi:acyl-CoA thioester hydrolase